MEYFHVSIVCQHLSIVSTPDSTRSSSDSICRLAAGSPNDVCKIRFQTIILLHQPKLAQFIPENDYLKAVGKPGRAGRSISMDGDPK